MDRVAITSSLDEDMDYKYMVRAMVTTKRMESITNTIPTVIYAAE